jgi:hypothetical protein
MTITAGRITGNEKGYMLSFEEVGGALGRLTG